MTRSNGSAGLGPDSSLRSDEFRHTAMPPPSNRYTSILPLLKTTVKDVDDLGSSR